ncbi:hypothetical protein [Pleomorphochaeta sp. DL1XJH-081]|uniref:hypothetical protein n=1 Tax=Pleomorphochaeta sp. DL1XJH-081 TaxID=3409690 RepID=UPI003BB57C9B
MKVSWTAKRDTVALVAPRDIKPKLDQIFQTSDDKHNGHITITIETVRKPRTTGHRSQSHHLNGHIQQIAEYTGMPFELIKLEVKHRAVEMGYPMLLKLDGTVQTDIYGRVMGISEADSSTQECAILIETAHMVASEVGIKLQEE